MIVAGCKSGPFGPYVAARVSGQVLAGDTCLPLAGVKVTRRSAYTTTAAGSQTKGGELLMRKEPVRTDADGRFVLASHRVLSVVRGSGWKVVALSFERSGYQHFQTNSPTAAATNSINGEPLLDIGQVFLQPVAK
jgi:hypothetical protein